MKKVIVLLLAAMLPVMGWAAGGGANLTHIDVDIQDQASTQNGAKLFVNYCLSCHSAAYMRYKRLTDLGLSVEQITENLIFTDQKVGDPMISAMKPADAEAFFGKAPPDLSVIARSRGKDWLYSYLISFYEDPASPIGWNNTVFPDVGMPNVFTGMQGIQTLHEDDAGHAALESKKAGSLSKEDYENEVKDLVTYLVYMGEPAALDRAKYGMPVLLFLVLLTIVSYLMKREYWKDVH